MFVCKNDQIQQVETKIGICTFFKESYTCENFFRLRKKNLLLKNQLNIETGKGQILFHLAGNYSVAISAENIRLISVQLTIPFALMVN